MNAEELREKIAIYLYENFDDMMNPAGMECYREYANELLSLIKQGIEEAEPITEEVPNESWGQGRYSGISDYKSNLLQMVEGKKL